VREGKDNDKIANDHVRSATAVDKNYKGISNRVMITDSNYPIHVMDIGSIDYV
jgi:hypothetical protein